MPNSRAPGHRQTRKRRGGKPSRHHDHSYKQLFSHPRMVSDLLTGFVREEWVRTLDLASLETVKASFVTDDYRAREDDVIWRARWADDWLYV